MFQMPRIRSQHVLHAMKLSANLRSSSKRIPFTVSSTTSRSYRTSSPCLQQATTLTTSDAEYGTPSFDLARELPNGTHSPRNHDSSGISPTHKLCDWIADLRMEDVPSELVTRSKYLLLDGIACALTCAHIPVSEIAARAIFSAEDCVVSAKAGSCTVIGYPDVKLTPLAAATLNGTFIQGFELDDWHKDAPLHSNSIVFPALLAAAEHRATKKVPTSGADLLLGMIVGYETGPRVGNALYGRHILSEGWHSGAVFGPSASAAAVSKLYGLRPDAIEDALGIACTQASGLMSAQFEADSKRMQHGFAARNGLCGALLAKENYSGIKRVYEREYGGFLKQFSQGNGKNPQYKVEEICKDLGSKWQLEGVCIKPYGTMALTHCTIDCVKALQSENSELLKKENLSSIKSIIIRLDAPMFHHGGWKAARPLTAIGGQMSNSFVCATQLVERENYPAQYKEEGMGDDARWDLVNKTTCELRQDYEYGNTEVEITFKSGEMIKKHLSAQRGVNPPLSNEEIVEKWRDLARQVIDHERMSQIEDFVLQLEEQPDLNGLVELLAPATKNPLS